MLILTIRTDKPEAEVGLYKDAEKLAYETWQAHRQLAETIHQKIQGLLEGQKCELAAIQGIVIYKGPGSFTGLRIGFSVANALAYSVQVPIISAQNEAWINDGIERLQRGDSEQIAAPEYGSLPNITPQKH